MKSVRLGDKHLAQNFPESLPQIRNQPTIESDLRAVDFQLETGIKNHPKRVFPAFTY